MNRTSIRGVKKLMEKLNAGWTLNANPKMKIAYVIDPRRSWQYCKDVTVNWPALAAAEKRNLIEALPKTHPSAEWIDYKVVKHE